MNNTEKPENPFAFPLTNRTGFCTDGMTLRDYFAAKAMNGMDVLAWKTEDYSILAERAYLLADEMLKQREL